MTTTILKGDCRDILKTLPDQSVHCCVTSPPYFGLRDYGHAGQIGLEATPDAFVAEMVAVFREVRRVLRDDGTLWLNLGDSYAGSGKGGNPDPGSSKQATNAGSQTIGVLYGTGKTAREAAVTNVTRKTSDGIKAKDLIGIPWRVAFALQADGWYLRQDIIWSKPNPMPESVTDRCTKAHEYIFLMSKKAKYFYDAEAIKEASVWQRDNNPEWQKQRAETNAKKGAGNRNAADGGFTAWTSEQGRNKRSVWEVTTGGFSEAHFATFPPDLIEPCIKAGCPPGGKVLDPFGGAGTTGLVADRLQRHAILIELNPEYADMARRRIIGDAPLFADAAE